MIIRQLVLLLSSLLQPLVSASETQRAASSRPLTGRFLHITDMHPDPHYVFNSTERSGCHRNERKETEHDKKVDRAGWWGQGVSDCDAPLTLVNATFDWLRENWQGEVDFVIWTGDNARHDIDAKIPRTRAEIYKLNKYIADNMLDIFGDVPVVTTVGNNDIYPHNIMFPGPSNVITDLQHAWEVFIPESQYHTFARGAYYSVPLVHSPPHSSLPSLHAISLNTLYFYDSNKAVDGCPGTPSIRRTPDGSFVEDVDPGSEQLQWLHVQLEEMRKHGQQVWLMGHVPPSPGNWYEGCYEWYAELAVSYQDTIVGHLFGHMNTDHFFWFDSNVFGKGDGKKKKRKKKKGKKGKGGKRSYIPSTSASPASLEADDDETEVNLTHIGPQSIDDDLLADFKLLPSKKKTKLSEYAIVNVSPSVIPTYWPALRIWSYNVTEGRPELRVGGIEDQEREEEEGQEEDDDDAEEGHEEEEEETVEGTFEEQVDEAEVAEEDEIDREDELDESSLEIRSPNRQVPFSLSTPPSSPAFASELRPLPSLDTSASSVMPDDSSPVYPAKDRKHRHQHGPNAPRRKPRFPRHHSKLSPSRRNVYLAPLGYTQWYVDIEKANENDGYGPSKKKKKGKKGGGKKKEEGEEKKERTLDWQVEYVSYKKGVLAEQLLWAEKQLNDSSFAMEERRPPPGSPDSPLWPSHVTPNALLDLVTKARDNIKPSSLLSAEEQEDVLRDALKREIKDKDLAPYGMKDLTIKRWLNLARTLGRSRKQWKGFVKRLYVSSGAEG